MELSRHEEAEIPMPINSAYVGGLHGHGHGNLAHYHHHHHHHHDPTSSSYNPHNIIPSSSSTPQKNIPSNNYNGIGPTTIEEPQHQLHSSNNNDNSIGGIRKNKMLIKYRECQKNHAASMGGNSTDGCGEFMPNGEEGTLESLTCSACNCHRNFHRKEIEGEHQQQHLIIPTSSHSHFYPSTSHPHLLGPRGRKVILGGGSLIPFPTRSMPVNMPYTPSDQSDDHDHHHHHHAGTNVGGMMVMRPHNQAVKKRFRTKFSQEQKEKMLEFAERVGWKIQKQEEAVVQQFCQEVGVKRRVLKVWMHNNKHNLAKKNITINNDINNNNCTSTI